MRTAALAIVVGVTLASAAGCRQKSVEGERVAGAGTAAGTDRDDRDTKEAREAKGPEQATGASDTVAWAEERVRALEQNDLRERAEAIAALRREQLEYRGRIESELDGIDERLLGVKSARDGEIVGMAKATIEATAKRLVAHRDLLRADMSAIDRSTAEDWPVVRAKIVRDVAPSIGVVPRGERPWTPSGALKGTMATDNGGP